MGLLNPSPVQPIAEPLWPRIDTLVVNEIEIENRNANEW
jgi:ribokinase